MAIKHSSSQFSSRKNTGRQSKQASTDAPPKKRTAGVARALSSVDLRDAVIGWVKPKRVRSEGPLTKPEEQVAPGVLDSKMLKDIQTVVAATHQALRQAAEEDKTMRPGLKFLAKMARASEVQQFRSLFIENAPAAIAKVMQGVTGHALHLPSPEGLILSWSSPRGRSVLFDSLMADGLTRTLITVVATQPNWVRFALKFRRSMLLSAAKQGRSPAEVTGFSTLEMLQASKRLWKVENLTPLQIALDTVLLSLDGQAPALVGAVTCELWQPEKVRVAGYVAQISAMVGARVQAFRATVQKAQAIEAEPSRALHHAQEFVRQAWTASAWESIASRFLGAEGAKIFVGHVKAEALRLEALGAEIDRIQG